MWLKEDFLQFIKICLVQSWTAAVPQIDTLAWCYCASSVYSCFCLGFFGEYVSTKVRKKALRGDFFGALCFHTLFIDNGHALLFLEMPRCISLRVDTNEMEMKWKTFLKKHLGEVGRVAAWSIFFFVVFHHNETVSINKPFETCVEQNGWLACRADVNTG